MYIYYNGSNTRVEISEIYHPVHLMFHAKFGDGYENIFFTDVESGRWIEQDLGFTELAGSIGEKYKSRSKGKKSVSRKLKWHFSSEGGKTVHFAYNNYSLFDLRVFEIFSPNRRYLFAMVCISRTEWKVLKIPGDITYNNDLIINLTRILEPHLGY